MNIFKLIHAFILARKAIKKGYFEELYNALKMTESLPRKVKPKKRRQAQSMENLL